MVSREFGFILSTILSNLVTMEMLETNLQQHSSPLTHISPVGPMTKRCKRHVQ